MAASRLRLSSLNLLQKYNLCIAYRIQNALYCTRQEGEESATVKKSRFVEFDKKQTELLKEKPPPVQSISPPEQNFISLLKNSKFIAMGDPVGKIVIGKIYHIVGRDLYIDFGWKFSTVCTLPEKNKDSYVVGAKVKLLVQDLELSTRFLGSDREITLCEADCVLLGLASRPTPRVVEEKQKEPN